MLLRITAVAVLVVWAIPAQAQMQKGAKAAQKNSSASGKDATKPPGSKLSPERQKVLRDLPPVGSRARWWVRKNLEAQQGREDVARALAEQQAEAERQEAQRKAALRESAADANRVLKDKAKERGERARKRAAQAKGDKKPASDSKPEATKSETPESE